MPETKPLRIIHVVYSLEMGGAEVLVAQLCRIQRELGHDVSVCCYSKLGVIGEKLRGEGFTVRMLGIDAVWKTMRKYRALFRELKPDVVHCHNVAPTIQAALSARLAGVRRVISTRHRLPLPYETANEVKYSLACRFCDWVTGICEATCKDQRGAPLTPVKKVIRVYNGTEPVERVSFEHLGKRGFTMVCIGRLAPVKDVGTAIRAVKLALPRLPELQFWIVGDGKTRPELEVLTAELELQDHVKFWGQQMNTAPFYCAADVFEMSSLSEGLPMSLLQSMSLGTPAILTDVDGSGEVLRLTGGGMLVPVKSPEVLADAIVKMATDDALRAEYSRKALEAYHAQFTLEKMNDGYMALYR